MLGFGIGVMGGTAPDSPFGGAFNPGPGREVGLSRRPEGIEVWSELQPGRYIRATLDTFDPGQRASWRETVLCDLRSVYPVRDLSLTGGWTQLSSSGLGQSGSYIGNRGIQASGTDRSASITVAQDHPYDIWIAFTGRTSGGYARVEIDGAQDLVNEIDDPAGLGFKAFSTYSETDLARGQWRRVATGVTGSRTVTVRPGGAATPGGANLLLEAVATSATLASPSLAPPAWQPGTGYTWGDEVHHEGRIYVARGAGTSGTGTGPTHTSGEASDGGMNWKAEAQSTYQPALALDYRSEREYALNAQFDTQTIEIGGQTHGNEPLVSRQITLDGAPWSETGPALEIARGSLVEIMERTQWGPGLADCQLDREVRPGRFLHRVDVEITETGALGWFYPGMMPLLAYDGATRTPVFETVESADTLSDLSQFEGINPGNQNAEFGDSTALVARGTVGEATLSYGVRMSAGFTGDGAQTVPGAFLRPNLTGADRTGGDDWEAKAYLPRAGSGDPEPVQPGDRIAFASEHVFALR